MNSEERIKELEERVKFLEKLVIEGFTKLHLSIEATNEHLVRTNQCLGEVRAVIDRAGGQRGV